MESPICLELRYIWCLFSVVDCMWGSFSDCSKPCGGGTKTREIVRQAENGGALCEGLSTMTCNTQECPGNF